MKEENGILFTFSIFFFFEDRSFCHEEGDTINNVQRLNLIHHYA